MRNDKDVCLVFEHAEMLLSFLIVYLPEKFSVMHAAGGLVQHPEKGYLFIFKRGFWDLPKGKNGCGRKCRRSGCPGM
ncbi:MAG: hypothetical protein KatS3mg028_1137 [Bacteroidia bacterium]|nr:MAG: hypothetical protein KatS3mg028_1137 [Bacteroidia bacterium]